MTNDIIFRFNNVFNFDNTGTTLTSLMVDFDDGLCLHPVSMGSSIVVSYSSSGEKTLFFL